MGSKSTVAVVMLAILLVSLFFYGIGVTAKSRIYTSTGTISSVTSANSGLFNDITCTRIRFVATDFTILAYGDYGSLKIGQKYTFVYSFDLTDIATISSYAEIK